MRRKDRQITDLEAIRAILDKAKVLHLAMIDGARPYVVPMNYGYALADGRLSFTSVVTEYDENWNPVEKTVNVTGATLVWDGAEYTADENGVYTIPFMKLVGTEHSVQLVRTAENGLPTVLRFAPDYGVTIGSAEDPDDSQDQPQGLFARIIAFFRNLFQKIAAFFGKLFNK